MRLLVFGTYLLAVSFLTIGVYYALGKIGIVLESSHSVILFAGLAALLCIQTATKLTKIHYEREKPKPVPGR